MDDVYNIINDYNPAKKVKILIVFDDMIADIMTNEKFQGINKELLIRKSNILLLFIPQPYFSVTKQARLISTHYLIMKIHNKRKLQQIAINHWADIDYKNLWRFAENVKVNHILFWLLILHYQLIIL